MVKPLRVGVIGLGPLWRGEVRPALQALRGRFRAVCVSDETPRRAAREAKRLRCPASGVAELLERHAPDAVLLLDPQWYRLWPVELACRSAIPLLCCPSLELDADRAAELAGMAAAAPVRMALLPRLFPAVERLRLLLGGPLGPARQLFCVAAAPAGPPLDLVDACAHLFGVGPLAAQQAGFDGLRTTVLDFGGGRCAQVTAHSGPARPTRLEVIAERGRAVVSSPYRLEWHDDAGRHRTRVGAPGQLGRAILESLADLATRREPGTAGLAEMERLLTLSAGGRAVLSSDRAWP